LQIIFHFFYSLLPIHIFVSASAGKYILTFFQGNYSLYYNRPAGYALN